MPSCSSHKTTTKYKMYFADGSIMAVALPHLFSKHACGSGIPEMKAMFSGVWMNRYLSRCLTILCIRISTMVASAPSMPQMEFALRVPRVSQFVLLPRRTFLVKYLSLICAQVSADSCECSLVIFNSVSLSCAFRNDLSYSNRMVTLMR